MKKRWIKGVAVLLGVGLVAAFGYYEALKRAWIRYNEYDIRSEGLLKVGDLAPELELASLEGAASTKISELYRDRPLVLVFGSYT